MLLKLYTGANTWWAMLRRRAGSDGGATTPELGLLVALVVFTIVIAISLLGRNSTHGFEDLNVNYP